MRKVLRFAAVVGGLLVFTGSAHAVPILIDFEAFNDVDNLHGVNLGGVTLTAPLGSVEVFADNRNGASFHSPTKSVSNLTGGSTQDNPLTGTFDNPMSFVSLWAGDIGGDSDSWSLEAFDATVGGNSLGFVTSGVWIGTPYRQLTINAPGILRFEANFTGPSGTGIAYDDLSFVPEPTSMALIALGAAGLAGYRLRRRKAAGRITWSVERSHSPYRPIHTRT